MKDEAAPGAPFQWRVHAQTQSTTEAGKWDDVWQSTDDHAPEHVTGLGS